MSGIVNANNNWWGNNTKPTKGSANGYAYDGTNVTVSTWLVLTVTASPSTIGNQTSTITADLTHNNLGQDTSSQGTIYDGIAATFTTDKGIITSSAKTINGKATVTFSRGTVTSGTATIKVTFDKQTVQTTVIINPI